MIRHIVMFRLHNKNNQKQTNLLELKDKLESLKNKISLILKLETGINCSTNPNAFDLVSLTEFNNADDLEAYKIHPDHQKLVDFLNEVKEQVAVVDFHI